MTKPFSFKKINTPDNKAFLIPNNIKLIFPKLKLPAEILNGLVYIPWQQKYLNLCPKPYRTFFKSVLPYLKVRTTDVHTATCLFYLNSFVKQAEKEKKIKIDKKLVAYMLILHDCGWSALNKMEIANSLSMKGLKIKGSSSDPKKKHAIEGVKIAKRILNKSELNDKQKQLIFDLVLHHDNIAFMKTKKIPTEAKIAADLDHLWSFTSLNFWQDTVRKNINPQIYLKNLQKDLKRYFILETGKTMAKSLLMERKKEALLLPFQNKKAL